MEAEKKQSDYSQDVITNFEEYLLIKTPQTKYNMRIREDESDINTRVNVSNDDVMNILMGNDPSVGGNSVGGTGIGGPSASVGGPSASVGGPSASIGGPSASIGGPSASIGGPSASVGGPGASVGGPGASVGGPSASIGGPSASIGGPSASVGGPSASIGGPSVSVGGPSASVGGPSASVGEYGEKMATNLRQLPKGFTSVPPPKIGGPPSDFGGPPSDFGGPPTDFGGPPSDFGAPSGFGGPPTDFGGPPTDFGAPPPSMTHHPTNHPHVPPYTLGESKPLTNDPSIMDTRYKEHIPVTDGGVRSTGGDVDVARAHHSSGHSLNKTLNGLYIREDLDLYLIRNVPLIPAVLDDDSALATYQCLELIRRSLKIGNDIRDFIMNHSTYYLVVSYCMGCIEEMYDRHGRFRIRKNKTIPGLLVHPWNEKLEDMIRRIKYDDLLSVILSEPSGKAVELAVPIDTGVSSIDGINSAVALVYTMMKRNPGGKIVDETSSENAVLNLKSTVTLVRSTIECYVNGDSLVDDEKLILLYMGVLHISTALNGDMSPIWKLFNVITPHINADRANLFLICLMQFSSRNLKMDGYFEFLKLLGERYPHLLLCIEVIKIQTHRQQSDAILGKGLFDGEEFNVFDAVVSSTIYLIHRTISPADEVSYDQHLLDIWAQLVRLKTDLNEPLHPHTEMFINRVMGGSQGAATDTTQRKSWLRGLVKETFSSGLQGVLKAVGGKE